MCVCVSVDQKNPSIHEALSEDEFKSGLALAHLLHQTVKADLEVKRPTMDKLCSMSQDLLSSVKNKEVASKLEARLDNFAQRWDRLIQGLEMSSSQVHTQACTRALTMTWGKKN